MIGVDMTEMTSRMKEANSNTDNGVAGLNMAKRSIAQGPCGGRIVVVGGGGTDSTRCGTSDLDRRTGVAHVQVIAVNEGV